MLLFGFWPGWGVPLILSDPEAVLRGGVDESTEHNLLPGLRSSSIKKGAGQSSY